MYSISSYGSMIADEIRMGAYAKALQAAVHPDSVVVDIGAGTGILSLLACQYGARMVYAVEASSAIIVAEEAARANGFGERVRCIQARSTEITLPEPADVVVSDLRGVLPLYEQHVPSIVDARRRFLKPGGKLIPKRDVVSVAVVETSDHYDRLVKPWKRFELNMDAAAQIVTNVWKRITLTANQLLTKPCCWATMDYFTVQSPDVSERVTLRVARPGTAHGFIMWFDAVLDDGIEFSNAPGQPELIYGSAFFPWSSPIALALDDTVSLDIRADLVGSDYVWSWNTQIHADGFERPKACFRQSTFHGTALSPAQLHKWSNGHQPKLNNDGEIDLQILRSMDGTRSTEEIAELVMRRFPLRFRCYRDLLTRIADLNEKYSL